VPSITITGEETGRDECYIPDDSRYRVYSLDDEIRVDEGTASESVTLNLDLGGYRIKVSRRSAEGIGNVNWGHEFYIGMTEAQFKRIRGMKPRWIKAIMGTDSALYKCSLCTKKSTTRPAAVIHEMKEHFGVDVLTATDRELSEAIRGGSMKPAAMSVSRVAKRGPGRPRKNQETVSA
jgi:hypothetical protein